MRITNSTSHSKYDTIVIMTMMIMISSLLWLQVALMLCIVKLQSCQVVRSSQVIGLIIS